MILNNDFHIRGILQMPDIEEVVEELLLVRADEHNVRHDHDIGLGCKSIHFHTCPQEDKQLDCSRVQSILNNDHHILSIFQFLHTRVVEVMLKAVAEVYKSHTIRWEHIFLLRLGINWVYRSSRCHTAVRVADKLMDDRHYHTILSNDCHSRGIPLLLDISEEVALALVLLWTDE
jgi:hypothetical protein